MGNGNSVLQYINLIGRDDIIFRICIWVIVTAYYSIVTVVEGMILLSKWKIILFRICISLMVSVY